MNAHVSQKDSENLEQLKIYAEDLAKLYSSDKIEKEKLRTMGKQLKKYAKDLSSTIKQLKALNEELQCSYLDTIHRLCLAAEYRDDDTADHISRISRFCVLIAEILKFDKDEVKNILYASPMHDIGKIGIPDSILLKNGKLTKEEFDFMKNHTLIGAKILKESNADVLKMGEIIAKTHHEKWDGSGYPEGLAGRDIPFCSRIVGLIDTFDALTSKRPYKDPYPIEVAVDIIRKEGGKGFDPEITDIFLANIEEIIKIKAEVNPEDLVPARDFKWSERDEAANGVISILV
ncbi:HD domain-containing protein [bacterium]|nr:HD domain-containing protein [bacterium]